MSQAGLVNTKSIPPPPGSITDLEGQDSVVVPPNGAGIIHVAGAVVAAGTTPFTTSGNAGTNTETWSIQLSQAIPATDAANVGLSAFNSADFTVDANGFVSLVGGASITKVGVDASTPPGTNPVLPNASGEITVTGGQVAAGTTTNVIQTDSLAANTYTIQIQRSQAVASSTVGDNGVSHFNSSFFTVDANGFVSLNGSGVGETITGNSGGALSPTAGNWNIFGAAVAAGTTPVTTVGSGSTLTVDVQRSQAIAATNATNVGLAAFNSAQFSVDGNGFVSLLGTAAISGVIVDAHTAPGTSPVVPNSSGNITVTGGQVAAGTTTNVIQTDSLAANTYTVQIQRSQAVASSTIGDNGVSHFNSANFTVDANGFVSALANAFNYTNVNHAASPYTVLTTDYYISVDCSAGVVQLNFPNAPTFKQQWIVKDRTGNAAVNNITLTTPGGTVTFDGLTTYTMNSNYQAVNLLANATPTYEVY
jgi:hypothetical protein